MSEIKSKEVKAASARPKSAYDYSAENDSFVDHFIAKFILPPLLEKVVPWGLPANIITICSNTCVFIAFVIALLSVKNIFTLWFAIPVLIIAYLIGDCLDGGQARKTHTGSPLGEYMDHFLDCFVNAELIIPIIVCYHLTNSWVIFCILFVAYITQAAAFWERYSLGHMHFSKFSSTETVLTFNVIITISYFSNIVDFLQKTVSSFAWGSFATGKLAFIGNLKLSELILCGFIVCAVFSTVCNFIRTKGASSRFWLFTLLTLSIAIMSAVNNVDYYCLPYFVICLYSIDYISNLITRIVDKKKDPYSDIIIPAFMLIMLVFNNTNAYVFIAETAYLLLRIIIRSIFFIHGHKQYWYWKNPAKTE